MMRTLRDKKTMQVILWMIVVAFVSSLFLVFGKFSGVDQSDRDLVAKGGGIKITQLEFSNACQPMLDRFYGSQDGNPAPEEIKRLKSQVLDQLIDNAILNQTAAKLGLDVSQEELIGAIKQQPYFRDETVKFSSKVYLQLLQDNGMNAQQYEASEKRQILMQKMQAIISDAVLYTETDVDHYITLLSRNLRAAYTYIDQAAFEKKVAFTEEALKESYDSTRSQYDRPERAKVRHIFIPIPATGTPQDEEKAKKTLEDCRSQFLSGKEKFTDLVAKYSQDEQSKRRGGDLGWINRGSLQGAREFEDVIFQLKKGGISKPFKLQSGYHIVQQEDYEKAHKSTFAEVRTKVLKQYQAQKAQQKILSLSSQLAEKLKAKEALDKSAKGLGLPTSTTNWFNRGKGIPGLTDSKNAANELAGLYVKDWAGPISLDKNEYFFQIIEEKTGDISPEEAKKIRSDAAQRLRNQRLEIWLKDFMTTQRKKLNVKIIWNG
jgi:peptidyl-prolyl cis-trans isomerase D